MRDWVKVKFPTDLNINISYMFILLILLFAVLTLIVPTGRYFIAVGGQEFLVFAY